MFNVGDIVVCVNAAASFGLKLGSVYKVHDLQDAYGTSFISVREGEVAYHYASRFQHLVPQVPITEEDIKELI